MNWKNWPYWLKGSCVLLAIHAVISAGLLTWYLFERGKPYYEQIQSVFVLIIINMPSSFVLWVLPLEGDMEIAEVIILGAIQWFAIGSFLGWLHGKIKNRKQLSI